MVANTIYNAFGVSETESPVAYYCEYKDANQEIHTTSVVVYGRCLTSEDNCKPVAAGNPTYANSTPAHASLVGSNVIIQNQSALTVTAPTINVRGHTNLDYYVYKLGRQAESPNGSANTKVYTTVSESGNIPAVVYAVDKRGYKSEPVSVDVIVREYTAPSIKITANRTGSYDSGAGSVSITATRTKLWVANDDTKTDVNYWHGNGATTYNAGRIRVTIDPSNASLSAATIGTSANETDGTITISNLAVDQTYTLTFDISDAITTVTATAPIDKSEPLVDVNAIRSAIGVCEVVSDTNTNYAPGLYAKNLYTTYNDHGTNITSINSNTINLGDETNNSAIEIHGNIDSNGYVKTNGVIESKSNGKFEGELYIGGPSSNSKYGKIYLYNGVSYIPIVWYEGADE